MDNKNRGQTVNIYADIEGLYLNGIAELLNSKMLITS